MNDAGSCRPGYFLGVNIDTSWEKLHMRQIEHFCCINLSLFWFLAILLITGCMTPLKKSETLEFCNTGCNRFDASLPDERLYTDFYNLLKKHEGKTIPICDSMLGKPECKREGILLFWQGGWIPGPAYVKTLRVKEVFYDNINKEIKFVMEFKKKSFVWVPFFCSDVKGNIAMKEETNLTMNSAGAYCNWAGMGLFVLNMYISVDYINLNRGLIGGNYKVNGGGPLNGGGGTGHLIMDLAFVEEGDRVAERREEVTPPVQ